MSIVAPKGRKPLSAEALFRLVRSGVNTIAEPRSAEAEIAFTEALLSACALSSLPSPSVLALDQERPEGNVGTTDGLAPVPCDTPMHARLDPVAPAASGMTVCHLGRI